MAKVDQIQSKEMPGGSRHPVHQSPVPHIRRETREPLKTWSGTYQPLPMPRLLLSPYVGCSAGCDFCFIQGFPGLYHMADRDQVLTVFTNYPNHVTEQLDRLRVAPPAVLSPFTDPFQPINDRYQLSEHLVKECVMRELPLDIVTRYHVPDEVVAMLKHVPSARIQVSVDPHGREGNVPYDLERLNMAERIQRIGPDVVTRIDPLLPPLDELESKLERLVRESRDRGIDHVVAGFGQVPPALYERLVADRPRQFEQTADEGGWWSVAPEVRTQMAGTLSDLCDDYDVTMGILGDPNLQDDYGDFDSPFESMLPISVRRSAEEPFRPLDDCPGDCLRCPDAVCGLDQLKGTRETHRSLGIGQWEEWGRSRNQESLL
jgi:DNA repair photolyase